MKTILFLSWLFFYGALCLIAKEEISHVSSTDVAKQVGYDTNAHTILTQGYCDFLNDVAINNKNPFFDQKMASELNYITYSERAGQFHYDVVQGKESHPIAFLSFYNALDYAHWKAASTNAQYFVLNLSARDSDPELKANNIIFSVVDRSQEDLNPNKKFEKNDDDSWGERFLGMTLFGLFSESGQPREQEKKPAHGLRLEHIEDIHQEDNELNQRQNLLSSKHSLENDMIISSKDSFDLQAVEAAIQQHPSAKQLFFKKEGKALSIRPSSSFWENPVVFCHEQLMRETANQQAEKRLREILRTKYNARVATIACPPLGNGSDWSSHRIEHVLSMAELVHNKPELCENKDVSEQHDLTFNYAQDTAAIAHHTIQEALGKTKEFYEQSRRARSQQVHVEGTSDATFLEIVEATRQANLHVIEAVSAAKIAVTSAQKKDSMHRSYGSMALFKIAQQHLELIDKAATYMQFAYNNYSSAKENPRSCHNNDYNLKEALLLTEQTRWTGSNLVDLSAVKTAVPKLDAEDLSKIAQAAQERREILQQALEKNKPLLEYARTIHRSLHSLHFIAGTSSTFGSLITDAYLEMRATDAQAEEVFKNATELLVEEDAITTSFAKSLHGQDLHQVLQRATDPFRITLHNQTLSAMEHMEERLNLMIGKAKTASEPLRDEQFLKGTPNVHLEEMETATKRYLEPGLEATAF